MHLDPEEIERLRHGELPPAAEHRVRSHLADCAECRKQTADSAADEAQIFALLRHLDHPLPRVDAATLAGRAQRAEPLWGRLAAGVFLFFGVAGAAYALPGSPVRGWVQTTVEWIQGAERSVVRPAQVPERDAGVAGVAATPGKAFVIHFELPDSAGAARVSLTEGEEVTVRAPSGAATFTSGAERLLVSNAGSGATFEIGIPRDAPRVEIRVAGGRIFLKDGTRIVSDQPAENQHYVLPLLEP